MARTRSVTAHQKVLTVAATLFAERGIDTTSVDAIARASGVSKATIYKHWTDKDALALEALARVFAFDAEPPTFDSGDLQQDFVDALTYQPPAPRQALKARLMPHVMAYAARHRAFGDRWRERAIDQPQRRLTTLMNRGIAEGRLLADLDRKTALALLLGPILYWQIFAGRKTAASIPRELAGAVVTLFLNTYGTHRR